MCRDSFAGSFVRRNACEKTTYGPGVYRGSCPRERGCPDAVEQLHTLLEDAHELSVNEPTRFRDSYAEFCRAVDLLVDQAEFDGYALQRGGPPTVLHFAAGCGCLEACASLLARCGRLILCTDENGRTPLSWAANCGLCGTVAMLLSHGANPTHADAEGLTPLHLAASRGYGRTCAVLIGDARVQERGLTMRDSQGRTPLDVALAAGAPRAVSVLSQYEGSDRDAQMRLLDTLEHARTCGQSELAQVLTSAASVETLRRTRWRAAFDPPVRSLLNVGSSDAFLELGCARLFRAEFAALLITTRVVDELDLIESYVVEVDIAGENKHLQFRFARSEAQEPRDDVQFRIPRRRGAGGCSASMLGPGAVCRFRSLAVLRAEAATIAGVSRSVLRSEWSPFERLPG